MKELIEIQKEYIALLEKECHRLGSILIAHTTLNPPPEDVAKGLELRNKIRDLTENLNIK